MDLRKATVFFLSLALTAGLAASVCQAQDREREEREKAPRAERDRGPQSDNPVLEKLRALEKQQAELEKALDQVRQAARELRTKVEGDRPREREEARPVKPGEREREAVRPGERPKEPALSTEAQMRQRRLDEVAEKALIEELAEQSRKLKAQAEALAGLRPRAKAGGEEKEDGQGVEIIVNGQRVKLGAGGTFVAPGAPKAAPEKRPPDRETMERLEAAERELTATRTNKVQAPNPRQERVPAERRERAERAEGEEKEGKADEVKVFINGREIRLGGGEHEGKAVEGRLMVPPGPRTGMPAPGGWQQVPPAPGAMKPPMAGGTLKPMPGQMCPMCGATANPMPGGALGLKPGPQGQPGRVLGHQEREEREEMEEHGGREGREGRPMPGGPPMVIQRGPGGFGTGPGGFGPGPGGFGPGHGEFGPGAGVNPRPGAPLGARPPVANPPHGAPGTPLALGTPGMSPRPAAPQEGTQQLHQMMAALGTVEALCFNREMAAMAAIAGIKDDLKGRPIAAIRVLEASLRQVRTPGLRTAIHMTLKDLHKAQGNDEMVISHLRAILLENDAAIRAAGKKDKDDGDDEDEEDDD